MGLDDYYLAIDLGASSGRASLASIKEGKINQEIIHRFRSYQQDLQGHLFWDIIKIFSEIKKSIKIADDMCEGNLVSVGIDSWGVDYGYLDKNGVLINNPYSYRDKRTNNIYNELFKYIKKEEIYRLTGIQFMDFNTIGQLYVDKMSRPWVLEEAEYFLMIPDLLNYFLTGSINLEVTNLSTTQLFNPNKQDLCEEIFKKLDLPKSIFPDAINPGKKIDKLDNNLVSELDLSSKNLEVVSVASHDTASAISAIPIKDENSVYINNGTWSLLGVELNEPLINKETLNNNFTNEVGVEGTIRFLKNITGLWILEKCKQEWEKKQDSNLTYEELVVEAEQSKPDMFKLNPEDNRFARGDNMPSKIKDYCQSTGQKVPKTRGQIIRGIYESLAYSYADKIGRLENIIDRKINKIHMAGGGARSELFCKIVEEKCQRQVKVGPIEATVYGNILSQLKAAGEIDSIRKSRSRII